MSFTDILLAKKLSGGGGGSSWELIESKECDVTWSQTSTTEVTQFSLDPNEWTANDIIFVHIRDKAGKRAGYFYGTDTIIFNPTFANQESSSMTTVRASCIHYVKSDGTYTTLYGVQYTVFPQLFYINLSVNPPFYVQIDAKDNGGSPYGTIDGTFKIELYKLTPPSGMTIFN